MRWSIMLNFWQVIALVFTSYMSEFEHDWTIILEDIAILVHPFSTIFQKEEFSKVAMQSSSNFVHK